jgi:HD-GYP domain-containing protein (c-di-GMP phosphodiesterase class II)
LSKQSERVLYMASHDFMRYEAQLERHLDSLSRRSDVAPQQRVAALQSIAGPAIERTMTAVHADRAVEQSRRVGRQIVQLLGQSELAPSELFRMLRHDHYTYTHILNVSSYCLLLAERLGIRDAAQLEEITVGGLMHDLGKRHLPPSLLTKPDKLTPQERQLIEAHPRWGFEELVRTGEATEGQLMMVYQHHEHIDGGGYPVRVMRDEIHPWARLCAVADVFDALTCLRPYRKPMSSRSALEFMQQRAGRQFDAEMLQCWRMEILGQ